MNILNNPSKFQDFHAIEVVLEPSTWIIALNFEVQITTRTSWKWLGPLFYHVFFCLLTLFFSEKNTNPGPHPPSINTEAASFGGAVGSKVVVSAVSSSHSRDLRPTVAMGWSVENSAWKKTTPEMGCSKTFQLCTIYIFMYVYNISICVYKFILVCIDVSASLYL